MADEITSYVTSYAPELDPEDVRAFMAAHPRPRGEPGSHVQWATRMLREQGEGEFDGGPSLDTVVDQFRRHDR